MNPPTKGITMKIQKPSRKTKNEIVVVTSMVGASAILLIGGAKYLELVSTKTSLLQAYTLIKKMDELHPDALADAIKACDKELLEALIARTS